MVTAAVVHQSIQAGSPYVDRKRFSAPLPFKPNRAAAES